MIIYDLLIVLIIWVIIAISGLLLLIFFKEKKYIQIKNYLLNAKKNKYLKIIFIGLLFLNVIAGIVNLFNNYWEGGFLGFFSPEPFFIIFNHRYTLGILPLFSLNIILVYVILDYLLGIRKQLEFILYIFILQVVSISWGDFNYLFNILIFMPKFNLSLFNYNFTFSITAIIGLTFFIIEKKNNRDNLNEK